ncbi:DNA translocase FtsK 4TM domain-containing protein, partial [Candidatus Saccharibacteria bacterium]|nr:DNA translocase FtsK 4TM domain-containing protein [Candidatus Saccharibacteria bacterium]
MAKKRKQTRTKKKKEEQKEPSQFWPLAGAIVMMLLALFLLLGGFGAGGPLPEGLFAGVYWALGWAAYLAPVALIFFGIIKFMSEDKQIPLSKLVSMLAFLAFAASWLQVAFVSQDQAGEYVGGHGGMVGELLGNTTLHAITKFPASIMFFVLMILAFFLTFNISPKVLLALLEPLKRKEKDTDLNELKNNAEEKGFKVNEGVPVEHKAASVANLKNTAQKLTPEQSHEALTVASDPTWQLPSIELLNQKQDKADA